jgi:hypothetical protein
MTKKLTELEIIFASIHAKQKALYSALSQEQIEIYKNQLAKSKSKLVEKHGENITKKHHEIIDMYFV